MGLSGPRSFLMQSEGVCMNFSITQNVKVFEKIGAVESIGELMSQAGFRKAFLVCDSGIVKLGLAEIIRHIIEGSGFECVLFDKVVPDPPADVVDEGAAICKSEKCDCVIAVGGGSSIDTAKGVNILRYNEGRILDYADPSVEMKTSRGLIVIPTTSGTGSELSNGLIISDTANAVKVPILAVAGMSEYAILDPSLTAGMPAGLTRVTGLDVFSHACEAYTSVLSTTSSDLVCEKIMETVVESLPAAVADGNDSEARSRMLSAASLGGWMLACASAHVGHSAAHVLGAHYHIPHGKACAMTLPATLRIVAEVMPGKIRRVGTILGAVFAGSETPDRIGLKTAQAYRDFCASIGLLHEDMQKPENALLASLANEIASEPLASLSPVSVTPQLALAMLEDIFFDESEKDS